ncbi:hypothetical protein [Williamsia phyllosphaerae]|uniref:DUF2631 domain-containing protein n=1 Tax=Williamsia phyllosphaerae TaxID=885042 RepID=A0ABQ1V262_9NOCA|nr:hypothetical protein [Williamsia phyllosphaerae]GGF32141.1 hypothetical protein GCM10007298_30010 [Williamsia phyllosphaerae]
MDDHRFSPTQAVVGVVGLAVAVWGLTGAPDIADSGAVRWGVVGIAVLIGVVLIVVGGLSGRNR